MPASCCYYAYDSKQFGPGCCSVPTRTCNLWWKRECFWVTRLGCFFPILSAIGLSITLLCSIYLKWTKLRHLLCILVIQWACSPGNSDTKFLFHTLSVVEAPRVVITNGMVIPNYSSKENYERMYAMGVSMYGQMTAGSYAYVSSGLFW